MTASGAVLASLLLSVCPPIPESPTDACPQVYRVAGSVAPQDGINLLFVSHGFQDEELVKYRCAVRLLSEKLATLDPYSRAAPAINVFRMDLAIGGGMMNLTPICNRTPCPSKDTVWTEDQIKQECQAELSGDVGKPTLPETEVIGDCMLFDPEVRACPGGNTTCRVSWPSEKGFDQLWRLSHCAPNVHAIIVLTDNGAKSGGGSESTYPKMIVSTMVGIDAVNTRGNLLAHEIGHAFGLLDEYAGNSVEVGGDLPDYHAGRNVYSPAERDSVPPWKARCSEPHSSLETDDGCGIVPATGNTPNAPPIGLYEGAFYQSRRFYRAQGQCRMRNLSTKTFCAGCKTFIDTLIDDLDLPAVAPRE